MGQLTITCCGSISINIIATHNHMIKKKNYRLKHASGWRNKEDDVSPPTKVAKLTPWRVFLKDYGETEGKIYVHTDVSIGFPDIQE